MTDNAPHGLLHSLTVLAASLVALAHTRLDLLSSDLEEEREHLLSLLGLALASLFCFGVGVVLLTILLVVMFWETHRLLTLILLAGLFLGAGFVAWGFACHKVKNKPRLFSTSMSELVKDWQQLDS